MPDEPTKSNPEDQSRYGHARHHGIGIECVAGDITRQQDIQAIVNAANAELLPGGGVAGAIHRAAGPGLLDECLPLAPIKPGEAVLTRGHALPNPYVIHCLGPIHGVDEPAAELLADCYRNALRLADDHAIESVAFPAISTGAFGYPFVEATEVAIRAILQAAPSLTRVKRVRLIFNSTANTEVASETLRAQAAN
jgi:O-acetyl-ADP-ribose deacetylase